MITFPRKGISCQNLCIFDVFAYTARGYSVTILRCVVLKKSGKPLLLPLDIMTSSSWRMNDDLSHLLHHYMTNGNLTSQLSTFKRSGV